MSSDARRTAAQQSDLDGLLREAKEFKPLPAIALRLISQGEDENFSAQELAGTIQTDQALTLKILRLANSPAFGLPRRITSLREAIILLGYREIRTMALAACVADGGSRGRLPAAGLDYDVFWVNSLVIAHFAQALAQVEGVDRDEAFTAGVVHNLGRLTLAQHRPEWLARAVADARQAGVDVHEAEVARLGFDDCELGGTVARSWSFPSSLVEAIERHALPSSELVETAYLDSIVARARAFARVQGVTDGMDGIEAGMAPDPIWETPEVQQALDAIGGVEGVLERAGGYVNETAVLAA